MRISLRNAKEAPAAENNHRLEITHLRLMKGTILSTSGFARS